MSSSMNPNTSTDSSCSCEKHIQIKAITKYILYVIIQHNSSCYLCINIQNVMIVCGIREHFHQKTTRSCVLIDRVPTPEKSVHLTNALLQKTLNVNQHRQQLRGV